MTRSMPKAVGATLPVEAYTRAEAVRLLVDQVYGEGTADRVFPPEEPAKPAGTGLTMSDVQGLGRFAFEAYALIQRERHRIRAQNKRDRTSIAEPPYPPNAAQVVDILRKLGIWRDADKAH